MDKSTDTLCVELGTELLRLSACARSHADVAATDPELYVASVEEHFLQLLTNVADIRKAHNEELTTHRM